MDSRERPEPSQVPAELGGPGQYGQEGQQLVQGSSCRGTAFYRAEVRALPAVTQAG